MNLQFPRAAAFLILTTFKNRVLAQARRLRQPKYLLFTAIGALYFWSVFARRFVGGVASYFGPPPPPPAPAILSAVALAGILYLAVFAWIFGGDKAALQFSEAEVQFFFTGPVSRRALIHYRLIRALLVAAISAVLLALFRRVGAYVAFAMIGMWFALATLSMHTIGAALTRASLVEHGLSGWRRRLATLAVLVFAAAALIFWAMHSVSAFPSPFGFHPAQIWAEEVLAAPPIQWLLFPALAPLRVVTAGSFAEFLAALPAAVLVLGGHYLWAASSNSAFEEAAAEAAERRARAIEAMRSGRGPGITRRGKPLFVLHSQGAPWVAIFWKNLIASSRVLSLRFVIVMVILAASVVMGMWITFRDQSTPLLLTAAFGCAGIAAFVALIGPQSMRSDLRMDLKQMDLLRSYPLNGRDVVTAEVLAPASVLVACEVLLLVAGTLLSLGSPLGLEVFGVLARFSALFGACLLLASITLSGLLLRNAIVLYLPGWSPSEGQARGPEAIGQRMLLLVAGLIVVVVTLLPATIVGGVVGLVLWPLLGVGVAGPAAAAGTGVIVLEVHFTLGRLGAAFERFDLSES